MNPYYIIHTVCSSLGLDWYKLVSEDRHREYADGRYIAMTLIRERVKIKKKHTKKPYQNSEELPYQEIAYIFKKKTHYSPWEAQIETKKLIQTDKEFKRKYDLVVSVLDRNLNAA